MGLTHLDAPSGWWLGKIQDVAVLKSGSTPLRAEHERYFSGGTIPWVKTMDLTNGKIFSTDEMITETALAETSCPVLDAGTVLVAMYGGFNQIGRTGLMTFKGSINQAMSALVVKPDKAIPEYVLHWLNANIDTWRHFAASSRKDPNITQNDVASFPILIPPLAEQRRIAEILGAWDDAISLTGRLIDALKRRKEGLTESLVTGAVRFQEFEGHQWVDLPIGSFLTESRIPGGDGSRARKLTVKLYGKGIVEKEETRQGSENTQYYFRRADQFIYSKLDFLNGAFGIVPEHLDGYETTLDLPAFDINEGLNPIFFLDFVRRENFYKKYLGMAVGGRKARRIQPSEFLTIRIPVPEIEEQDRIATVLQALEMEVAGFETYSAKLRQQKAGLMQRLLTGQIRVRV